MLKTYRIEMDMGAFDWELQVEIDEDFIVNTDGPITTRDNIKTMVEFWTGWERALDNNDGNYTTTFLQQLARTCIIDQIGENHNLYGVTSYFKDAEGWCVMDGSMGIKLMYIEDVDFSYNDFIVEEVTNG